jgi:hypothetical protein
MRHPVMHVVAVAALAVASALLCSSAQAQTQPPRDSANEPAQPPSASHDGKTQMLPARPLRDSEDELNSLTQAQTVDGLVLVLTIDGTSITVDSAVPARVPRRQARSERVVGGDLVRATAFASGQAIATTVAPDTVLNASEGGGLVRTERRQVALVLAVDRAVETVVVEALATNARATLDVRQAYARACETDRNSKWCPRPR